jgi:hypothetical protein
MVGTEGSSWRPGNEWEAFGAALEISNPEAVEVSSAFGGANFAGWVHALGEAVQAALNGFRF